MLNRVEKAKLVHCYIQLFEDVVSNYKKTAVHPFLLFLLFFETFHPSNRTTYSVYSHDVSEIKLTQLYASLTQHFDRLQASLQ